MNQKNLALAKTASALPLVVLLTATAIGRADDKPQALPGTELLDWTDDISVRMVDEAHRYLDRKIAESIANGCISSQAAQSACFCEVCEWGFGF